MNRAVENYIKEPKTDERKQFAPADYVLFQEISRNFLTMTGRLDLGLGLWEN